MVKISQTETTDTPNAIDLIRGAYLELLGQVPASIEGRITVSSNAGRIESIIAIENLRDELIMNNPLGMKTGQLVHFGQLLALGEGSPAISHAGAAYKAGASIAELLGVAELALITSGMPAYALGVEIISNLIAKIKDSST